MRLVLRATAISMLFVAPITFFVLWYWGGDTFTPDSLAGKYILKYDGGSSNLTLKPDQTFDEELNINGEVKHAQGKWKLVGENHIAFSPEFLKLPGQATGPNGAPYGELSSRFGVVWINLDSRPDGLSYRKPWFH
jgi:hypothetical protein